MKFKTIAEAFNHYRTSTLEEIERRAAEIKNIVATDATADVDALNIELEGLSQAKQNVQSRAAGGQQNSFNPVAGAGMAFERRASYEATEGDVFNSAEYRSAFMKRLLGRKLNSFEEAAFGTKKEILVPREENCAACGGTGAKKGTSPVTCSVCGGSGQVRSQQNTMFGSFSTVRPCDACGGTGKIIKEPCPECKGRGRVNKSKRIVVNIPAGIDNGQILTMRGEGEAGLRGGPAGDLYISITVRSHKLFTRKGSDLYITMDVPMTVAALGGDIQVPTLSGTVKYHIPEGTQPGTTFRLREQGIVRLNTTQKGDLMVKANIVIPKKLTAEQKDMIKKLADSLGDKVSEAKVGKKTIFDKVKDKWN